MSKPLVITQGDPSGIGPEIIVKAFRDHAEAMTRCFVAGDVSTIRRAAAWLTTDGQPVVPVLEVESTDQMGNWPPRCVPVFQAIARPRHVPAVGLVNGEAGRAAGEAVVWAARAALRGQVRAMVTAPLHKEALAAAGSPFDRFPGHTEMLQALAAEAVGKPVDSVPVRMMLANDELRTVLVSIHVSLRAAIDAVTLDNVLRTIEITHDSVGRALRREPRIAVAGLNPHAGEHGLFGSEEREVIEPAIESARRRGWNVHGPFAPDTVFMRARSQPDQPGEFDVVIAMYHDQGLIPVKYLGVDKGVNVTLGLPFVRTSPDHGTAFDIAGTGRADPGSLIAAVRMARELSA